MNNIFKQKNKEYQDAIIYDGFRKISFIDYVALFSLFAILLVLSSK